MIAALLLPLLIAGGPAVAQPAALTQDDPPIQLWINNDRRFFPGDRAKVQVRTRDDGYLLVFHVDPDGYLRVLFPLDPDKDNFVRGGKKYEVRGRGGREAFEADARGRGTIYAAVSRDPFHFDGFVLDDHWDYRALSPSRLSSNPEAELNELVRRMAQGNFDYDILSYEVADRVVYASDYTSRYYGSVYDDPWCYTFSCGHPYYGSPYSLSIGLFFGRPYRHYYYDPYFYAYDPYYSPFFYDPYYYRSAYHPRYVYPHNYYPYRSRFDYGNGNAGLSGPFTRYRFGGPEGVNSFYRDRSVVRRAVNTVYYPPVSPVREPASTDPVRRVVESRRAVEAQSQEAAHQEPANRVAPGRTVDQARRMLDRPIEAHRARPVEQEPSRSSGEPRLVRREVDQPATPNARPVEPARQEPRQVERTREDPPRVERSAPAPDRGGGRSEGRSSGGSSRSNEGGRRRR